MKQIVDKLNKIAKKIDESVEIPQTDLIIDSLDAITKAYGGTPNDSHLIVDKLEDIYNNISSAPSGNIDITENTAEGTTLNIAQYATAKVNVETGVPLDNLMITLLNNASFTGVDYDGEIVAEITLPLYRALPIGSNKTVQVKLDNNDYVEYPVALTLNTGDFVIGDPEDTLRITGNMSTGLCSIFINDTNTHTITVRFRETGVPTVFECDGGTIISLRTFNYLFIIDCLEISPGHSTTITYPIPLSAGANNKPLLYPWVTSGGPK